MAIRIIREEGDEILRKKSREVEVIDEKTHELIKDMIETLHKYQGVGLAAVQVGILKRIFIICRTLCFYKSRNYKNKRRTNSRRGMLKFPK